MTDKNLNMYRRYHTVYTDEMYHDAIRRFLLSYLDSPSAIATPSVLSEIPPF